MIRLSLAAFRCSGGSFFINDQVVHWFYVHMFYQPRAYWPYWSHMFLNLACYSVLTMFPDVDMPYLSQMGLIKSPNIFFAANIAICCMSIHHIFLVTFRTDLLKSPYSWATCHGIMNTLLEPPKTIHLSISPNVSDLSG